LPAETAVEAVRRATERKSIIAVNRDDVAVAVAI
jgi:hypothetical protein